MKLSNDFPGTVQRAGVMDPDPAFVWLVGKFVSARSGPGCLADVVASLPTIDSASCAGQPTHAEGVTANGHPTFTALSDVSGVTGQAILRALAAGKPRPTLVIQYS